MPSIAYAAYTDACTFLLDAEGICRRVVLRRRGAATADAAERCIGAQYVASIDTTAVGGLVPMPCAGAALLFAFTGEDGRIGVVRTGPLVRFETRPTLRGERRRSNEEVTPVVTPPLHLDTEDDSGARAREGSGEDLKRNSDLYGTCEDDSLTVPLRESGSRRTRLPESAPPTPRRSSVPPPRSAAPTLRGIEPADESETLVRSTESQEARRSFPREEPKTAMRPRERSVVDPRDVVLLEQGESDSAPTLRGVVPPLLRGARRIPRPG
jgi:hypothetical protein